MRFGLTVVAFVVVSCLPTLASPRTRRGPTSQHFSSRKTSLTRKPLAQREIDSERTTQIQTALISQGYLDGSPTGTWSPETQEALRKMQADNGWQTKMVPDSRAIIKLGLGPNAAAPEGPVAASATAQPSASEVDVTSASQQ